MEGSVYFAMFSLINDRRRVTRILSSFRHSLYIWHAHSHTLSIAPVFYLFFRRLAQRDSSSCGFRFGFHANPSLPQLHLHIISLDFESEYMKSKKHYMSFTSDFLVSPTRALAMLEESCSGRTSQGNGSKRIDGNTLANYFASTSTNDVTTDKACTGVTVDASESADANADVNATIFIDVDWYKKVLKGKMKCVFCQQSISGLKNLQKHIKNCAHRG